MENKVDLFNRLQQIVQLRKQFRSEKTSISLRRGLKNKLYDLIDDLNKKCEIGHKRITMSDIFDFLISNLINAWESQKKEAEK